MFPKTSSIQSTFFFIDIPKIKLQLSLSTMATDSYWTMVDSKEGIQDMLDEFANCSKNTPDLFLDLEGEDLGRTGTLLILQILLFTKPHVYLVDCIKLRTEAFETRNSKGTNLKDILESSEIKKAIFDVRNDSAALYHQYGISLAGVEDIQLMELATRNTYDDDDDDDEVDRDHLRGLGTCISGRVWMNMSQTEWHRCIELKRRGRYLFEPRWGGSYTVFSERPLKDEVMRYCVLDVCVLPATWNTYSKQMSSFWQQKVLRETTQRIADSQDPHFGGKGRHMAKAPYHFNARADIGETDEIGFQKRTLDDAAIARCFLITSAVSIPAAQKSDSQGADSSRTEDVRGLIDGLADQKLYW